jgi:lipopolysaccharide/colanic/teichoic acid biosynthesis glycosyltransferase/cellulose synthase/poly-beta-1,6-N-acetylglucosamine synthase-like glycosyltransferase
VVELLLVLLSIACLGLALHPFTTYPLSLMVFGSRRRSPPEGEEVPALSVSLLVAAYNEEAVIRVKAANLLELKRRMPDAEILIYVDAASDATAAILSEYAPDITVVEGTERTGKTAGMQRLAALARNDVLVFSDANVMFEPDAVAELLRGFTDPTVACVCGRLIYTNGATSTTAAVGSLYWRLEEWVKRVENANDSVLCADGSIFAMRRALYPTIPPDIIDDFYASLSVLCDGHRLRRAERAIARENSATDRRDEFRRKVRIACQAFNVHRLIWPRLRRAGGGIVYRYVSHKFLRWFMGPLLALAGLFGVLAAAVQFGVRPVLIGLSCIGLMAAFALLLRLRPAMLLVEMVSAWTATALGVWLSLRGERFQTWTPADSVRIVEHADHHRPISANRTKRAFDLVGAGLLVVVFGPLMLVLAMLARRDGGPALFAHTRIGAGGKPFRCLKFRTMRVDAERMLSDLLSADPVAREEWTRTFKLRHDPRVTPFGEFLRRTSLDELPQLFNVLRGDMSLVGPRPIVADEVAFYDRFYPFYTECRPGITGLWQVSGRSDVDYARRVALDRDYVATWSVVKDVAILLRTPATVLRRRGAY